MAARRKMSYPLGLPRGQLIAPYRFRHRSRTRAVMASSRYHGLALIVTLVGIKMLIIDLYKIPIL